MVIEAAEVRSYGIYDDLDEIFSCKLPRELVYTGNCWVS